MLPSARSPRTSTLVDVPTGDVLGSARCGPGRAPRRHRRHVRLRRGQPPTRWCRVPATDRPRLPRGPQCFTTAPRAPGLELRPGMNFTTTLVNAGRREVRLVATLDGVTRIIPLSASGAHAVVTEAASSTPLGADERPRADAPRHVRHRRSVESAAAGTLRRGRSSRRCLPRRRRRPVSPSGTRSPRARACDGASRTTAIERWSGMRPHGDVVLLRLVAARRPAGNDVALWPWRLWVASCCPAPTSTCSSCAEEQVAPTTTNGIARSCLPVGHASSRHSYAPSTTGHARAATSAWRRALIEPALRGPISWSGDATCPRSGPRVVVAGGS